MQLSILLSSIAVGVTIVSAAVIPDVSNTAKFTTSRGKHPISHFEAEPWLPPITGKPDPQWGANNGFYPKEPNAGDPSLANRYQAGRKDAILDADHDAKFDEVKRDAMPEAEPRWCGRPGEPCWVKRAITA